MKLALVGDIHMYRLFVAPWELVGKPLAGQANIWLRRRRHFDRDLLAPALERVAFVEPDLLLLSGDLSSIAAKGEFTNLARTLGPLVRRFPTVAVPGNHDRYTHLAAWRKRMERALPGIVPSSFPYLRPLNASWKLLALDTAVPRWFSSRGRVGEEQLTAAHALVKTLTPQDGLVVLAHYALDTPPPLLPMKYAHRLADADGLIALLAACPGPVLYLHGHVHYPWCWPRRDDGLPRVLDINAGAPCLKGSDYPAGQGFWQIDLPEGPAQLENVVLMRHIPGGSPAGPGSVSWKTEGVRTGPVEMAASTGR